MKMMNIGLVNLIVSTQLREAFLNDGALLVETQKDAEKLLNVVKSSPILQLEFRVFDNIEHKHIVNENLAMRYIDDNVKLFEVYTISEIEAEHEKLKSFVSEDVQLVEDKKVKLYEAVWILIEESLMDKDDVDVDNMHEAFNLVLDHIKTNAPKPQKEVPPSLNEEVIEIAINKFNEKYEQMSLDEAKLFKTLVEATEDEKKELFEDYKSGNLEMLTSLSEANTSQKLEKSIEKINEMEFKSETADVDIVSLFELKKGLG